MTTIVLDNEAVQALGDPSHAKHRRALAAVAIGAGRGMRSRTVPVVVPTAVRVEAGWDRTARGAAVINRLRIQDHPLGRYEADDAAGIVDRLGVSVADAHIGATVRCLAERGPVVVITSDPKDVAEAAQPAPVEIVRL